MWMLLTSMMIYGSIGIFRRYLPLPSAILACIRGVLGAVFLIGAAALRQRRLSRTAGSRMPGTDGSFRASEPDSRSDVSGIDRRTLGWLVISGAVMGFNWIFLFEAYNYTTVATATLCYYMEPTIVVLLSPFLFGEKITGKKGICAVISIIGMVFVSGIVGSGMPAPAEIKGVAFGLAAAFLYALVVIINKKLPGIEAYRKTTIQLLAAAAAMIPYILITGEKVSGRPAASGIVMLLIVGFIHTGLAYVMYFGSMDGLRAQTIAILSYVDPITALVLSTLLLHEKMTIYGILGSLLILGAALISEAEFRKGERT